MRNNLNWTNQTGVYDLSDYLGFIYRIDYDDGNYYIGKKAFYSSRKKTFGKKKLAAMTDGRAKKYEIIRKESNWREYEGSCKNVGDRVISAKYIVKACKTAIDLTYAEAEALFKCDALFDDKCLNRSILGSFYSAKLTGGKE